MDGTPAVSDPKERDQAVLNAEIIGAILLNMEASEIKLLLFTSQLHKVQIFYSALGMNWVGGRDSENWHDTRTLP
jgi:hypothetical protein